MIKNTVVLLLLLSLCSPLRAFDVEGLLAEFGSLIPIVLNNFPALEESVPDAAQCGTPDAIATTKTGAQCLLANYPIPPDIINEFMNAKTAKVAVCDLPPVGNTAGPLLFAFSLSGNDVSYSCPEGAVYEFDAPILLNNVPAVYNVYDAASIVTYSTGDILAVVTDADGAIVSATTSSDLPPGVGFNVTGTFYVSNKDDLLDGVYNVTVTTTDAVGGQTTQVVTITLLGAICNGLSSCGIQCYNPTVHHCILFDGRRHLCVIGQIICNPVDECCYDPTLQSCINGSLCPIGDQLCGPQCYSPTSWDCVDALLTPKGYLRCGGASYDPTDYVCLDDSVLCPFNTALCGAGCYDATVYDCCDGPRLCPSTFSPSCGC